MILHGNQRGNGRDLAIHLTKPENERVELHEMRGFVSDTLDGALRESYAISKGTKCKQHLYSLSINPPADADIRPGDFVEAANRAEKCLGLDGQPRAIVFHDKRGFDGELRRHAHAVWCRIDPDTMTARQLSYDKEKLREVSRDLHIKHDLKMPPGLINSRDRNPRNFSLEEWQQCKRTGKDLREVQDLFQDCWSLSDSPAAFAHALEERGYVLAQGRRGHVAVDFKGEKYPVSRYVGVKAKDVRARLGDTDGLPDVEQAQQQAAAQITERLKELKAEQQAALRAKSERDSADQRRLKDTQARETTRLKAEQTTRWQEEEQSRKAQLRRGLWGLWDRVTGKRQETQRRNAQETQRAIERDQKQVESLTAQYREKAASLKQQAARAQQPHKAAVQELETDIRHFRPEPMHDPPDRADAQSRYIEQQRQKAQQSQKNRTRDGPEPGR